MMANPTLEMCSGSEAGSYLRLIGFVYQSTLGLRVIKKKKKKTHPQDSTKRCVELNQTSRYRGTSLIGNSPPP